MRACLFRRFVYPMLIERDTFISTGKVEIPVERLVPTSGCLNVLSLICKR